MSDEIWNTQKKPEPCRLYQRNGSKPGSCKFGDRCLFLHESNHENGSKNNKNGVSKNKSSSKKDESLLNKESNLLDGTFKIEKLRSQCFDQPSPY